MSIIAKIDVEGFEEAVLSALLSADFADDIVELFVELDDRWVDATAVRASLKASGFQFQKIVGAGRHYDLLASRGPIPERAARNFEP